MARAYSVIFFVKAILYAKRTIFIEILNFWPKQDFYKSEDAYDSNI